MSKRILLIALFALWLVSCGQLMPAAGPTQTPLVLVWTATVPPATATSPATQTPYVITATPLPATATAVPTNTSVPTNTPAPTATAVPPTATSVPPTAVPSPTPGYKYLPPTITTPVTNPTLGPGDLVISWDFPAQLEDDEWFQVVAWKEQSNQERHSMTWTKDRTWSLNGNVSRTIQMFPWISGVGGTYYFAVQVIQGKDGKFIRELSRESAPWPWRW